MPVNQRPQWTVVEIASHAENATSLSELTLPEVKRMAARILDDQRNAPDANRTDTKRTDDQELHQMIEEEYAKGFKRSPRRLD